MNLHERAADHRSKLIKIAGAMVLGLGCPEPDDWPWPVSGARKTYGAARAACDGHEDELKRLAIQLRDIAHSQRALIAEMDARIRELEADAERLDWLENNEAVLASHREEIDEGEYAIFWQVADRLRKKSLSGHPLGSPRDALDAARKESAP